MSGVPYESAYLLILEFVFNRLEQSIAARITAHVREQYGAEVPVMFEQPKQSSFGDLAIPVAFQLARQLKQAPKAIATKLIAGLGPVDGVSSMEVAGNGYINVRFDRGRYGESI